MWLCWFLYMFQDKFPITYVCLSIFITKITYSHNFVRRELISRERNWGWNRHSKINYRHRNDVCIEPIERNKQLTHPIERRCHIEIYRFTESHFVCLYMWTRNIKWTNEFAQNKFASYQFLYMLSLTSKSTLTGLAGIINQKNRRTQRKEWNWKMMLWRTIALEEAHREIEERSLLTYVWISPFCMYASDKWFWIFVGCDMSSISKHIEIVARIIDRKVYCFDWISIGISLKRHFLRASPCTDEVILYSTKNKSKTYHRHQAKHK